MNIISKNLDDAARWLESAIRQIDLAGPSYENSRTEALGRVVSAQHLIETAQRMLVDVAVKLSPMPELTRNPKR